MKKSGCVLLAVFIALCGSLFFNLLLIGFLGAGEAESVTSGSVGQPLKEVVLEPFNGLVTVLADELLNFQTVVCCVNHVAQESFEHWPPWLVEKMTVHPTTDTALGRYRPLERRDEPVAECQWSLLPSLIPTERAYL